jgi:hypothetical protein
LVWTYAVGDQKLLICVTPIGKILEVKTNMRFEKLANGLLVRALLVIPFLIIPACTAPDTEPTGPDAWLQAPAEPGPIELIGHYTTETHAGDRGVSTHPDTTTEPAPSFCIAYFDFHAREVDDCFIATEPFEWTDGTYPWTVRAVWANLEAWDAEMLIRLSIHAFDQQGQPMAYWDGRMAEDAGHLTE